MKNNAVILYISIKLQGNWFIYTGQYNTDGFGTFTCVINIIIYSSASFKYLQLQTLNVVIACLVPSCMLLSDPKSKTLECCC